jgi:O-methyltransferase
LNFITIKNNLLKWIKLNRVYHSARKTKQFLCSLKKSADNKLSHSRKEMFKLAKSVYESKRPYYIQGRMDIDQLGSWHNPIFSDFTGGFYPKNTSTEIQSVSREIISLEKYDNVRRDMLILLLRTVIENKISGEFAELGVFKGQTAKLIHYYCPERNLYLFDTFSGFDKRDINQESKQIKLSESILAFQNTSSEAAIKHIEPINDNISIFKGYFPQSIPRELNNKQYAFVHLDADLYVPTIEGLKFFYPKVPKGGMIVCHDYNAWPGVRKAVDEFFHGKQEVAIPMPDKSGSALIIKI